MQTAVPKPNFISVLQRDIYSWKAVALLFLKKGEHVYIGLLSASLWPSGVTWGQEILTQTDDVALRLRSHQNSGAVGLCTIRTSALHDHDVAAMCNLPQCFISVDSKASYSGTLHFLRTVPWCALCTWAPARAACALHSISGFLVLPDAISRNRLLRFLSISLCQMLYSVFSFISLIL